MDAKLRLVKDSRRMVRVPLADLEEQEMELRALTDEARAHARRMRLAMQSRFWSDPDFARFAKPLLREVESFERRFAEDPERAA